MVKKPSVLLLITAGSLSPFAMSICIPALPLITESLLVKPEQGQFIISVYLFGLALAQPFHGLLADRYGRRPVILISFTICFLASVLCFFAESMIQLTLFRFIQAFGVAAGTVVARAVIRDTSSKLETARLTALLAGGMGLAPTIAPLISGYLIENTGWEYCFIVVALFALLMICWLAIELEETRPPVNKQVPGLEHMRVQMTSVIKTVSFWKYTLITGFGNAAFFSYLTNAPVYFQTYLGLSPSQFGTIMGLNSIMYFISATTASRLIKALGMTVTLHMGLIGMAGTALLIMSMALLLKPGVITVLVPYLILFFFAGLVQPSAMAGAVISHPKQAGTAAGLSNSIAMMIGGLSAMLSPYVLTPSMLSLGWPVALMITLGIVSNCLRDRETERLMEEPEVATSYDAETVVITEKD